MAGKYQVWIKTENGTRISHFDTKKDADYFAKFQRPNYSRGAVKIVKGEVSGYDMNGNPVYY